ncbi:MAG: DUF4197 domain-containing protein, partial [Gammaproteobacteria bacterium]|nr:DUF4197 domain-containing protein [Gammaproteobacteria bacterium]
ESPVGDGGLSVEDAKKILNGGDDAATRYFREKTETPLTECVVTEEQALFLEEKTVTGFRAFISVAPHRRWELPRSCGSSMPDKPSRRKFSNK